jgi:hypothetical protein
VGDKTCRESKYYSTGYERGQANVVGTARVSRLIEGLDPRETLGSRAPEYSTECRSSRSSQLYIFRTTNDFWCDGYGMEDGKSRHGPGWRKVRACPFTPGVPPIIFETPHGGIIEALGHDK